MAKLSVTGRKSEIHIINAIIFFINKKLRSFFFCYEATKALEENGAFIHFYENQEKNGWSCFPSRADFIASALFSKCATIEADFAIGLSCDMGTK